MPLFSCAHIAKPRNLPSIQPHTSLTSRQFKMMKQKHSPDKMAANGNDKPDLFKLFDVSDINPIFFYHLKCVDPGRRYLSAYHILYRSIALPPLLSCSNHSLSPVRLGSALSVPAVLPLRLAST